MPAIVTRPTEPSPRKRHAPAMVFPQVLIPRALKLDYILHAKMVIVLLAVTGLAVLFVGSECGKFLGSASDRAKPENGMTFANLLFGDDMFVINDHLEDPKFLTLQYLIPRIEERWQFQVVKNVMFPGSQENGHVPSQKRAIQIFLGKFFSRWQRLNAEFVIKNLTRCFPVIRNCDRPAALCAFHNIHVNPGAFGVNEGPDIEQSGFGAFPGLSDKGISLYSSLNHLLYLLPQLVGLPPKYEEGPPGSQNEKYINEYRRDEPRIVWLVRLRNNLNFINPGLRFCLFCLFFAWGLLCTKWMAYSERATFFILFGVLGFIAYCGSFTILYDWLYRLYGW